jgi:translation initiation factor 2B subunit (eIF-2B alpha/beta/delta family)
LKLDALVAPLRADVVSGAAVIGRAAADVVRRAVLRIGAEDTEAFRTMLAELSIRILEAQPAMAPLVALTSRVLGSFSPSHSLDEAREKSLAAAETFKKDLSVSVERVAEHAGAVLHPQDRVLILSSSSTVRRALLLHGGEKALRVVCLEARPMGEGKNVARELARSGIPVTYAVDAAAGTLASECDLILLGADSVGDLGIVNKIGSLALCCIASRMDIPLHVLVDRTKLLPPGFPQDVQHDRPEEEVWKSPHGVKVWNRYFESLSPDSVRGLVTEEGVVSPRDLQEMRSRIPVPPELREWASARTS